MKQLPEDIIATNDKIADAKELLRENGYYIHTLYHIDDVSSMYDCTDSQAMEIIELAIDNDGKIWVTDTQLEKIGVFDPKTEQFQTISLAELQPLITAPRPVFLEVDSDNNVWVSVPTKNAILKYNQNSGELKEYKLPTTDSGPFGLLFDPSGKMWCTQTLEGRIGYIDLQTDEIREIPAPEPFSILETLTFDKDGNILNHCLTWMDTRGAPMGKDLVKGIIEIEGYGITNLIKWVPVTGGAPTLGGKDIIAHILYLKEKKPEIYQKTWRRAI